MKKFTLIIFLLSSFAFTSQAQILNPVQWTYAAKKISDKLYEVRLTAVLEKKWHIYAQDAGEGPEPTTVSFAVNPLLKLDGKVKEIGNLEKSFDPNFNSVLKYYSNKVEFVQKVKAKSNAATLIKGTVSYMVCNDEKCLPPREVPFTVKIPGK